MIGSGYFVRYCLLLVSRGGYLFGLLGRFEGLGLEVVFFYVGSSFGSLGIF